MKSLRMLLVSLAIAAVPALANPLSGLADSAFQSKKDQIMTSLKSCISPATNEEQLKQCLLSQLNPLSASSPMPNPSGGAASQLMQNPGSALQSLGNGL
ncbi:hypothetical protein [Ferrovum sp.]|uniref:hypothetical protein n=2 Tax=Ferrovum sp. TaxID=2609467 RepID=UPI00261D52DE|nr:hypothetical protein [Ferrovum sp.]